MSAAIVAPRRGMPSSLWLGLTLLILLGWSFSGLEIEGGRVAALPKTLARMFGLFFPPDVEYGRQSVVPAILESIQIAWVGTLMGATLSLPLGLLASANLFPRATRLVKPVLAAVRAGPELLLAIYFVTVVGLGAFAGTLAIGLHSIGTLGKLTADVVESMDQRPIEAVAASGGGALSVLRFAVLPQVLPEIIALWLFRFEISLRASAVLGVVGAGGIGGVLYNTLRYREFPRAGAVVVLMVVVTLAIDAVSGSIRERLVRE